MENDDYSDIKKIVISSDKEFNREFEEISGNLVDTNLDWNKRLNAIKKLEGIIIGGAYQLPSFSTNMTRLYLNLATQVNDLRSAVSLEACRLVCLLAKKGGDKIEGLCEKLITKESLLKLINNGNKLLAENGHRAILALLNDVQTAKIFPRLVEELQSRNVSVRAKIAEYLCKIFEIYPLETLDKNIQLLENAILAGVSDASRETRVLSRGAFKLYAEKFAGRAQRLFVRLDASAQKMLNEEGVEIQYKPIFQTPERQNNSVKERTKNEEASNGSPTKQNGKRSMSVKKDEPKFLSKSSGFAKIKEKKSKLGELNDLNEETLSIMANHSYNSLSTKAEHLSKRNISAEKSLKDPSSLLPSKNIADNLRATTPSSSRFEKTTALDKLKQPKDASEERKRLWSSNLRGIKEPVVDTLFEKLDVKRGSSPSLNINNLYSATPNTINNQKTEVSFDGHNTNDRTVSRLLNSAPGSGEKSQRLLLQAEKNRTSTKNLRQNSDTPKPKRGESVNQRTSNDLILKLKEKVNIHRQAKEVDLASLIENCNDENWSVRFHAFEKIMEFITTNANSEESLNQQVANELVKVHIRRISDPHIKVSIACMASFTRLIAIFPDKIKQHLSQIFPQLVDCLMDKREKVHSSANFLVNVLHKVLSGDDMIEPCLQSLDKLKKSKGRISLLEIINVVVPKCEKYFESQFNFRQIIQRMGLMMAEASSNRQLVLPCLGILINLRDRYFQTFMPAFLELSSSLQTTIRSLSCQHAPDLEETIRDFILIRSEPIIKPKKKKSPKENLKNYLENYRESLDDQNALKQNHSENISSRESKTAREPRKSLEKNELNPRNAKNGKENGELLSHPPKGDSEKDSLNCLDEIGSPRSLNPSVEAKNGHNTSESPAEKQEESSPSTKEKKSAKKDGQKRNSSSKKVPSVDKRQKELKNRVFDLQLLEHLISNYTETKEIWNNHTEAIVESLFRIAKNSGPKVSELAIQLILNLLDLPLNFGNLSQKLVDSLIEALHLFPKHPTIEEAWSRLLSLDIKEAVLEQLIEKLAKEEHPVLQLLIKYAGALLSSLPVLKARPYLPSIFEKFKELINHANPDVRKVVVFHIVDLYMIFRDDLREHIQEFSVSQQKLISIYISRKLERSDQK